MPRLRHRTQAEQATRSRRRWAGVSRQRREPEEFSPRAAMERWLNRQQGDMAESTVYTYKYRLKLFVEWCEEQGIDEIGELRKWDLDEYYSARSTVDDVSHQNEMKTLTQFVEYLDERLGAVEEGLADAIEIPDVDRAETTDDTVLDQEEALALLAYYRDSDEHYATRGHALLELLWWTGARKGALRALDIRDVDLEEGYVNFVHRPSNGTPLKKQLYGQRSVNLSPAVAEVLDDYIADHRNEIRDEQGRAPVFTSTQGRPATSTITNWSYLATLPCLHGPCPHGEEPASCKYTRYSHASKCPSSRSPHQVRSGSITWQLNRGVPPETVAERVNSSLETIRWYYDWATEAQRWERFHEHREQRAEYITNLSIDA